MPESCSRDVSVGHDSRAIALTSWQHMGFCEGFDPGSPKWLAGIHDGVFLPIGLDGDRGGTCVRVLFERELSAAEDEEWIDHFAGRLQVDDGRLIVCGSTDFLDEQQFVDTDMVHELAVPSGAYRVDVFATFTGINGRNVNNDETEIHGVHPLGSWFRSTRPNEPFPLWLRLQCYEDPNCDPGHEAVWANSQSDDLDEDTETAWVDFIVRLTRLSDWNSAPAPPLDIDGFVPVRVRRRTLEKCPLGLKMC